MLFDFPPRVKNTLFFPDMVIPSLWSASHFWSRLFSTALMIVASDSVFIIATTLINSALGFFFPILYIPLNWSVFSKACFIPFGFGLFFCAITIFIAWLSAPWYGTEQCHRESYAHDTWVFSLSIFITGVGFLPIVHFADVIIYNAPTNLAKMLIVHLMVLIIFFMGLVIIGFSIEYYENLQRDWNLYTKYAFSNSENEAEPELETEKTIASDPVSISTEEKTSVAVQQKPKKSYKKSSRKPSQKSSKKAKKKTTNRNQVPSTDSKTKSKKNPVSIGSRVSLRIKNKKK